MWDLQFIDLILFLSEKYVTAETYWAIAEDTWGELKNRKLKSAFSEVCLLCFAWWMAVMAIQLWIYARLSAMCTPSTYVHIHPHTKPCTPPSLILQSHFSYLLGFLLSSFLRKKMWEHWYLQTLPKLSDYVSFSIFPSHPGTIPLWVVNISC